VCKVQVCRDFLVLAVQLTNGPACSGFRAGFVGVVLRIDHLGRFDVMYGMLFTCNQAFYSFVWGLSLGSATWEVLMSCIVVMYSGAMNSLLGGCTWNRADLEPSRLV
jgi:hypothetical protein